MKAISQPFSDCGLRMTNIQKISLSKIVDFVPFSILQDADNLIVDFEFKY